MGFSVRGVIVMAALGAVVGCSSSSTSPSQQGDAGTGCSDSLTNVLNIADANGNPVVRCPTDANGVPLTYDQAITQTCSSQKLKSGDIQYGQCLDYLVWEVDLDGSGTNLSKCFYDVSSHQLVGVVYGDGMQDQCNGTSSTVQGGTAEATCRISGQTSGGGGSFQSCAPVADAGAGG